MHHPAKQVVWRIPGKGWAGSEQGWRQYLQTMASLVAELASLVAELALLLEPLGEAAAKEHSDQLKSTPVEVTHHLPDRNGHRREEVDVGPTPCKEPSLGTALRSASEAERRPSPAAREAPSAHPSASLTSRRTSATSPAGRRGSSRRGSPLWE